MSWGVVAAILAVVTGGLAGGAVAFAAPGLPSAPTVVAGPDSTTTPIGPTRQIERLEVANAVAASDDETAAPTPITVADETVDAVQTPASVLVVNCPGNVTGSTAGAPATISAGGVAGTSTADLDAFAAAFNAHRVANCLAPVPLANVRYDACMEQRLFWMAEDPSTNTSSAWGHIGSVRSDGVPSVGCDGNLAGGMNNIAETFARKWWDSPGHRISLYNPEYTGSMSSVCIYFAVTHGGVPDEPAAFARAAARWGSC